MKLSNSAVKRFSYITINAPSNTVIHREPIINIDSNSRVKVNFEMSGIPSNVYIINSGTEISILSNTTIFNLAYGLIIIKSRTIIKEFGKKITKLSDTRIKKVITIDIISSTSIRRDRANIRVIFQKGRQL